MIMRLYQISRGGKVPEFKINEILKVTGGESYNFKGDEYFSEFEFDTRNITNENTLFFALSSDNNDGHRFDYWFGNIRTVNSWWDGDRQALRAGFSFEILDEPMPVELIYFNAHKDGKNTIVSWKTATEINNDFFKTAIQFYDGKPISLPEKFQPLEEFLSYHRDNIFEQ